MKPPMAAEHLHPVRVGEQAVGGIGDDGKEELFNFADERCDVVASDRHPTSGF